MIKIRIGSYEIEVNNVQEARDLMGMYKEKKIVKKVVAKDPEAHSIPIKIDGRKNSNRHIPEHVYKWTMEEVDYLLENLKMGGRALAESKMLRTRHPKWGILQMYYKAKNPNSNYQIAPAIQARINDYYAKH